MQPYFQLYSQTAVKLNPFVWRTFKCNDSSDSWLWNGFLERALRIKTNNIIAVFFLFFLWFLFNYAIQGKFITWLVNSTLNCTWKPISHSSLRDSCNIGFCVQFNMEFPLQVMNFPIIVLEVVFFRFIFSSLVRQWLKLYNDLWHLWYTHCLECLEWATVKSIRMLLFCSIIFYFIRLDYNLLIDLYNANTYPRCEVAA